jgi:hypothetical protein
MPLLFKDKIMMYDMITSKYQTIKYQTMLQIWKTSDFLRQKEGFRDVTTGIEK